MKYQGKMQSCTSKYHVSFLTFQLPQESSKCHSRRNTNGGYQVLQCCSCSSYTNLVSSSGSIKFSLSDAAATSHNTLDLHLSTLKTSITETSSSSLAASSSTTTDFLMMKRLIINLADIDPATAKLAIGILGPFLSAFGFLFILRIVMSWYPKLPVGKFPYVIAYAPTEPLLIPTRKVIPPLAGVDVTPVVWFGLLSFLNEILVGPQGLLVLLSQQVN